MNVAMNSMDTGDLQFFDGKQEVEVSYRKLPHWAQAGTLSFLTFRTHDSIPRTVLQEWIGARQRWLTQHGIDPQTPNWHQQLEQLPPSQVAEFKQLLGDRWHQNLDDCHGECVLKRPELAEVVARSLQHFHGERYLLTDFVVMPNHVHVLAAFADSASMLAQCDSWKHFTAREINKSLGRSGRFWQQDGFGHLLRSEEEFIWLRKYIADNPTKARLKSHEYLHHSLALT